MKGSEAIGLGELTFMIIIDINRRQGSDEIS